MPGSVRTSAALALAAGLACAAGAQAPQAEAPSGAPAGDATATTGNDAPATAAGAGDGTSDAPAWVDETLARLREALQREAEPQPVRVVRHPEGDFTLQVPARPVGEIESDEDRSVVRLDIGSEAPVECWLFAHEADLGSDLQRIGRSTLATEGLELQRVATLDAGVTGSAPWLALDWLYRLARENATSLGLLKQRIGTVGERSVYCRHDEIGYRETFRAVFDALLGGLVWATAAPSPRYTEIGIASLGGRRVGFQRLDVHDEEDGSLRAELRAAILFPVDESTVRVQDTMEVQRSLPSGALVHHVLLQAIDGEPVTRLEFTASAPETFRVEGRYQGAAQSHEIRSTRPPASVLGQYAAVRQAIAAEEHPASASILQWIPAADPADFMATELAVLEKIEEVETAPDGLYRAVSLVHPRDVDPAAEDAAVMRMDMVVDESGSPVAAGMQVGGTEVRIDRVVRHGRL